MPKLRRLSGKDIVKILEGLGFSVVRIRGSHHIMKRVVNGHAQMVNVPVHGNKDLAQGCSNDCTVICNVISPKMS